jgi:IclR family acetate operon transcriptional repressor
MSGSMEKALAIIEYLAARPDGASLVSISTDLNQIRSGCHRTLNELVKYGYVRSALLTSRSPL